ncbi:MAG: hypothetical protein GYA51_03920 [Candidatus Methanofastidiosa archaeon]|nr:hypothetical protein [Candidatus Methanofastidiosa archaeon]
MQYFPPDSLMIDLPFILTQSKMLTRKMPYMLLEKKVAGEYIAAVRLMDFHERDGIISLDVQELANNRTYSLSWNMEYTGDWWLWTLTDLENLFETTKY